MARQMKTDPQEALMGAMMLFWREGYFSVSTRQIEDETGLTRFTLQTTHGGKKAFFIKTLDAYLDLFPIYLLPQLQSGSLEDIASWFEARPIPKPMHAHICNGCMMVNSITEFGREDDVINTRAERYFDMLRGAFSESLTRVRAAGALKNEIDIDQASELLLGLATALNIAHKSAAPNARPAQLGAAAGALVRSWRSS